jgi:hypothetical protein
LIASAAASTVTFGRASYTIATTPSGTLTFRSSIPFGSVRDSSSSPTGSGSAAMSRTPSAIACTRAWSSASRSSSAASNPAARPSSRSPAFASMISSTRASTSRAIASRAPFLVAVSSVASRCEAAFARSQISVTDWVPIAMLKG